METKITRPQGTAMVVKCPETEYKYKSPVYTTENDTVLFIQDGTLIGAVWGGSHLASKAMLNKRWAKKMKKGLFSSKVKCDIYYVDTRTVPYQCDEIFSLSNGYKVKIKLSVRVALYGVADQDWVDYHILNDTKGTYFQFASTKGYIGNLVKKVIEEVAPKHFKFTQTDKPIEIHTKENIKSSGSLPAMEKAFFMDLESAIPKKLAQEYMAGRVYLSSFDA